MTGFKRIFRAAAMTGLLAGAVSGVSAQEVKLKFHHFSSPHGWDGKVMVGRVVELIEQGSKGRIDVTVFPGMQLGGKPSALVDQVTDGVVDLIYTLPGYTAGRFPILAGLELPFLGAAGAEVTTRLAWDFYDAYARGEFNGQGARRGARSDAAAGGLRGAGPRPGARDDDPLADHEAVQAA